MNRHGLSRFDASAQKPAFWRAAVDPFVFGSAALVLVSPALIACYLPVLRATRPHPIGVLRFE
jgi:hypothetical protein